MTVAQLIKHLRNFDDSTLVIMASDSEGNEISPLSRISMESYVAESTYWGYLEDEDDGGDGVKAVVFWPTN